MRAPHYVVRRDSDGRHVLEPDLVGGGIQVYIPGDELPDATAEELGLTEPKTKPVRKTTKPRRAATK